MNVTQMIAELMKHPPDMEVKVQSTSNPLICVEPLSIGRRFFIDECHMEN